MNKSRLTGRLMPAIFATAVVCGASTFNNLICCARWWTRRTGRTRRWAGWIGWSQPAADVQPHNRAVHQSDQQTFNSAVHQSDVAAMYGPDN